MEEKRKPRRYRMDEKGQVRRTWNGRLPEEMDLREQLLFAAETDLAMYGMMTVDTLNAIREAGYRYDNGELLSLEGLAAQTGKDGSGKYPAVYRLSLGEAKQRDELEQFRRSSLLDSSCQLAIYSALMVPTVGNDTVSWRMEHILEDCGRDRVEWILAHSIVQKKDDGHISEENKQWAASFHVPRNDPIGGSFWMSCVVDVPADLLEQTVNLVRKELTVDRREPEGKEQKASILEQLNTLPVASHRQAGKSVADKEVR